ncbi:glycerate kinase, partial [Salmonella enterica subsp. enterica serovar Anatum]|nr:glycerate kinase [Salmonella enterica subsp. enterica serovar Anatum]
AIEKGFREIFPDAQYVSVPVADGGEGTVEAMIAATQGVERAAHGASCRLAHASELEKAMDNTEIALASTFHTLFLEPLIQGLAL